MLDTKTGRLWQHMERKDGLAVLHPVFYQTVAGDLVIIPNGSLVSKPPVK
jgi:hypothetical protein